MKQSFLNISFGLLILVFFSGCISTQSLLSIDNNIKYDTQKKIEKSYTLGNEQTVFIGNSMIRVKEYQVTEKKSNILKASEGFLYGKYSFAKFDTFEALGSYNLEGQYYTAVSNLKLGTLCLLIDDDGKLQNKVINKIISSGYNNGQYLTTAYTYEYEPKSAKLLYEMVSESFIKAGDMNYELIYTGKDKESFKLLYREFTSDDIARPSFYQTLTYDLNSKKIRFKNLTIQINRLDNEKINFTVISDN